MTYSNLQVNEQFVKERDGDKEGQDNGWRGHRGTSSEPHGGGQRDPAKLVYTGDRKR